MTLETRIKRLCEVSGLSEEEVKRLIEKKKKDAAGLLTDHGAIYALEKEHGVGLEEDRKADYTQLSKLKSDLNNVNILGRIKEIRPIKKFQTERRSGQFARIVLADQTGEANIVLWDKTAELVNSDRIGVGTLLSIRNAYTKQGLDKSPEVHVGGLSRILIEPKNISDELLASMPQIQENLTKIGSLKPADSASTLGRILYLYPKAEFDRPDGRKGQRSSMIIEDETGKIRVVLWDANADRISGFSEGDVVRVEGGQVREGNRGLEMHIGNRGRLIASSAKLDLPKMEETRAVKIAEIEPNLQNITVAGRVMRILPVKEFMSGDRAGKLASLIIVDETGISRAVLWGEKTEYLKDISIGDIVLIKNAYVKQSLNGEPEVHLSQRGALQVNPPGISIAEVSKLASKHAETKSIGEIKPEDRNISVTGTIGDIDENAIVFEICSECGARIENVAGEWLCDICGEATPAYGMVISCGISDGSGSIRTVFYRDVAEELTGLSVPEALNLIGQSGDELEPLRHIRDCIIGKRVTVVGSVRYNEYQDKLELVVSSISSAPETAPPVKTFPAAKGAAILAEKPSVSKTPKKSAPKKKGKVQEDTPKEILEEDIEVEEINLDE